MNVKNLFLEFLKNITLIIYKNEKKKLLTILKKSLKIIKFY